MTHEELQNFRKRFEEIKKGKEPVRTKRLATLMTNMEECYNIPMRYSTAYAYHNPEVMKLYREVSYARDI